MNSDKDFIWAGLFHMGTNMWNDSVPETGWEPYVGEYRHFIGAADHLRFDEKIWRSLTARMAAVGMNMVVIDLGEAIQYPSHPELWVEGSWEIGRFRKELARLRAMGLEPIPKLNFSATHDAWLKEYSRMLSTPEYYRVCADLVRDVCEIFDHPRLMHLGYDEESYKHQKDFRFCAMRQGELWWHDFLFIAREVERRGTRPWIWSDYAWHYHDLFYERMPRSVLQSNFYYADSFDMEVLKARTKTGRSVMMVKTYEELDKAGFDQIPCGSNFVTPSNIAGTVAFARKKLSPERLKGFLATSWRRCIPGNRKYNLAAIDQLADGMDIERCSWKV
jgi:hypothetical protein